MPGIAESVMRTLGVYSLYRLRSGGVLRRWNWFRSFDRHRLEDAQGRPIPLLTYALIEFLERRVRPEFHVFEYGAGASTLWWAARVARIDSVEHSREWVARIQPGLPPHAHLHFCELEYGGQYCRAAELAPEPVHVAVIDGRDRVNCALRAVHRLRPDGVIIWDDSERPQYAGGIEQILEMGFRRIEFSGLRPLSVEPGESSILYRPGNCLGI